MLRTIRCSVLALASALLFCGMLAAAADFHTACATEPDQAYGPLFLLHGEYTLAAQPATGEQPALPVALKVQRAQCRFERQRAYLVVKMTQQGADVRFPKVTVVQGGKALGWFGADFSDGAVRFGQGFSWEPARAGQDGRLVESLQYAVKPDDGVLFDPLEPFQLQVEYTYGSPPRTPVAALDIPGAPFDAVFYPANGFWWNAGEPGWGLFTQRNVTGTVFAVWFTFDELGNPTWFYMPNGQPTARGVVEGDVYQPEGPAFGAEPFDSTQFRPGLPVGRFRLGFPIVNGGPIPWMYSYIPTAPLNFHYDVRGHAATKQAQRLVVETFPGQICDGAAMYWNPAESGWGLVWTGDHVMAGYCSIHAVWATYGPDHKPTWLFAPMFQGELVATSFDMKYYAYTGAAYAVHGSFYGAAYAADQLRLEVQSTTFKLLPERTIRFGTTFNYSPGRSVPLDLFSF